MTDDSASTDQDPDASLALPAIPTTPEPSGLDVLRDALTGEQFSAWRRQKEWRENIAAGNHEYNVGGYPTDDRRHKPHQILQCHRKTHYKEANAPGETRIPEGHYELGSHLEEAIVEPWLRELAHQMGYYVINAHWTEATVETDDAGTLTLAGSTDPVFCRVDHDEVHPAHLTEIKSVQSLSQLDEPKHHHKAQATCYQYSIADQHSIDPPSASLVYISRKHLDVKTFYFEFDTELWDEIKGWMAGLSEWRLDDTADPIPIGEDILGWECDLCPFANRCGEGDEPWRDVGASGFLPRYHYPRDSVVKYLVTHPNAVLTPTLGHQYPGLAEEVEVADWECPSCEATFVWDGDVVANWDGDPDDPPWCPRCVETRGRAVELRGPTPDSQPA